MNESLMDKIDQAIEAQHLLKHPFYQAWSRGELSLECLQEYAKEYYHHVEEFPKYLSAAHSRTDSKEVRKTLLENLVEEEGGSPNHPDLWREFAINLGVSEEALNSHTPSIAMQSLVESFKDICQTKSTVEAVAALYTYESQIPTICHSKIDGLKKHYGIDAKGYRYFSVHIHADEVHAAQERQIIESIAAPQEEAAILESVKLVLARLNSFLSMLVEKYELCPM